MTAMTEETLVARAQAGDRSAMQDLLVTVAPSIRRFALRMCRNEADADDVLQDSLLSITTHLDSFEGRSSVPSWAFALARSACARRRRGKKNQPTNGDDVLETRAADGPGPEDHATQHETSELVMRALEGLSEDHREVLLLRDAEGLTAPEAAVVLGVSVDALKSRLHRARAALRDVLRPVLEADATPRTPDCPDVVRSLSQKLEGELDVDTCAVMEKHIAGCTSCARTCDAVKAALQACRSATPTLTPEIQERVRSAIAEWLRRREA